jgi:large subunit ribosomal protein L4
MPEKRTKKSLKSTKHHAARKTTVKTAGIKAKAVKKTEKKKAVKASKAEAVQKNEMLTVFDMAGKNLDSVALDPIFQGDKVNTDIVYQAVLMYQAGEREGTAATKDRGHVRGGGKKPWKQKGTGQARHGSRRSPIWRGGGVTFGPMPRDYSYSLPQQMKRGAVVETMKDKAINGKLMLLNKLDLDKPKTRLVVDMMNALKLVKPLVLVDEKKENLLLASRNIRNITVKTAAEVNALDVASHKECLMTKAAYTGLVKRLKS